MTDLVLIAVARKVVFLKLIMTMAVKRDADTEWIATQAPSSSGIYLLHRDGGKTWRGSGRRR